ncbi:serine/threonine-protein phosphatase 4 regulatory subunit 4 [Anomaloglossus baeobatrachus]|uniref:serine/threonine-protein phosphatase 4 regulatory subunit 4 n=1 Tax=Anomaloglossus baeobatrachus TaxID=238106 RepID=UPI003F4FA595
MELSLFGYIEDLQELAIIERPVRRSLKVPSGQDIQGTSVVANLPVLIRQNPSETLRRVVPKIREVLHVAGVEMQLTAAYSFLTILQEESVPVHSYCLSFLQIILQNLEHRDIGVSNAWLDTLLAVIDVLPKETIRHEILNPLVSKAQLSQTLQSRVTRCRILGKLASKFEAHIVKRDILPLVESLCQDVEYEVRSCMCRQLEFIAQGIGAELTKAAILPELVELARDEGSSVRLAAFETLVNLLSMFDHGTFLKMSGMHVHFKREQNSECSSGCYCRRSSKVTPDQCNRESIHNEQIEKEKQQSEARSSSEKSYERKRRDSKTGSALPKSLPTVISGSSSGTQTVSRESKKSKLIRSQSFSSQAIHPKHNSLEKGAKSNSVIGVGKNVLLPFVEDSLKSRTGSASASVSFSTAASSRSTANTSDQKTNGSKEAQSRKLSLKNKKSKS